MFDSAALSGADTRFDASNEIGKPQLSSQPAGLDSVAP